MVKASAELESGPAKFPRKTKLKDLIKASIFKKENK